MGNERNLHIRLGEFAEANADAPIKLKHLRVVMRHYAETIDERFAALVERIERLEQKPAIEYRGTYEHGRQYLPGNAVTFKGCLWICTGPTSSAPSFDGPPAGWKLAAKKGRDSRDPKDRAA